MQRTTRCRIGLNQPPANPSNPSSGSVIAGDGDDNGNAGTVNPAVTAIDPLFTEFYALGGPEQDGGLPRPHKRRGSATSSPDSPRLPPSPTPTDPSPEKPYQVAVAIPNISNPKGIPTFGTPLPANTGNVYLNNSAAASESRVLDRPLLAALSELRPARR